MPRALLTGLNGTVAPIFARRLRRAGYEIVQWNRAEVSPDDGPACESFIEATQPDLIGHFAMGSETWAEGIAKAGHAVGAQVLYVSSVSVFGPQQPAPLTPDIEPEPGDDYGRYKLLCEQCVREANPDALITRLSWQIDEQPGGNTMTSYFQRMHDEHGVISASTNWTPACAFLEDTADALMHLLGEPAGVYHLDANAGLSAHDLATRIATRYGHPWTIEPADRPVFDNRMNDQRVAIASVETRLAG